MKRNSYFDAVTAKSIVDNPYQSKIIYKPPVKPRGGDVYVFSHGGDIVKADDWKSDQFI